MGYPTSPMFWGGGMIYKRKQKIAAIHIAKVQCGLSDDEYRELLISCAGITSAADLKNEDQVDSIMAAFKKLGFMPRRSRGGTARSFITRAQESYIRSLWENTARNPAPEALDAFVNRITHALTLGELNRREASKVIEALRQMSINKEEPA